ncbi:preprotein translocase subunit SecA, partial [Campylobacter jejuni]|nr:preprotein translocase subunit SecA [Campylobacter jejuni]
MFLNIVKAIFGTKNARAIKKYFKRVAQINALEEKYQKLSDEDLKKVFADLKDKVIKENISLDSILMMFLLSLERWVKRTLNMRHFDVQLIGGMVL